MSSRFSSHDIKDLDDLSDESSEDDGGKLEEDEDELKRAAENLSTHLLHPNHGEDDGRNNDRGNQGGLYSDDEGRNHIVSDRGHPSLYNGMEFLMNVTELPEDNRGNDEDEDEDRTNNTSNMIRSQPHHNDFGKVSIASITGSDMVGSDKANISSLVNMDDAVSPDGMTLAMTSLSNLNNLNSLANLNHLANLNNNILNSSLNMSAMSMNMGMLTVNGANNTNPNNSSSDSLSPSSSSLINAETTTINGVVYNSRGYEVCGQLNQHSKPCQRIGRCPFHAGKKVDGPSPPQQPAPLSVSLPSLTSSSPSILPSSTSSSSVSTIPVIPIPVVPAPPPPAMIIPQPEQHVSKLIPPLPLPPPPQQQQPPPPPPQPQQVLPVSATLDPERVMNAPPPPPPIKKAPYKQGWTKEEHIRFLNGLQIHGKGAWKEIAQIVGSRTPTQIQSHAQKYYLRQKQDVKSKRSIHDLSLQDIEDVDNPNNNPNTTNNNNGYIGNAMIAKTLPPHPPGSRGLFPYNSTMIIPPPQPNGPSFPPSSTDMSANQLGMLFSSFHRAPTNNNTNVGISVASVVNGVGGGGGGNSNNNNNNNANNVGDPSSFQHFPSASFRPQPPPPMPQPVFSSSLLSHSTTPSLLPSLASTTSLPPPSGFPMMYSNWFTTPFSTPANSKIMSLAEPFPGIDDEGNVSDSGLGIPDDNHQSPSSNSVRNIISIDDQPPLTHHLPHHHNNNNNNDDDHQFSSSSNFLSLPMSMSRMSDDESHELPPLTGTRKRIFLDDVDGRDTKQLKGSSPVIYDHSNNVFQT